MSYDELRRYITTWSRADLTGALRVQLQKKIAYP